MKGLPQVLELATEILGIGDARELDRRFCEAVARVQEAELASIFDVDHDAGVIRFRYSMDLSEEEAAALTLRMDEGICGAAASSGRPIAVFDVERTPQHSKKVSQKSHKCVGSLLAVPLEFEGRTLCVIEVMNRRSGPFAEEDKSLALMLGTLYLHRRMSMGSPRKEPARKKPARPPEAGPRIVGASFVMERVLRLVMKAAPTDLPVLILGETGSGKELVAQRIHAGSRRGGKPLVAINCAALSETLLESELFGHAKGAFTGASRDRRGRLEEATGGSVFLDEVGDMTPACQAKLLRALDYGEITPVGSNEVRKIDIRLIAATNQPLSAMVEAGKFRADLFFRLRGFQLDLPPLRDRGDDIPLLAEYFLEQIQRADGVEAVKFSEDAAAVMRSYRWPGNVRELYHVVKTAAAMAEDGIIQPTDLPMDLHRSANAGGASTNKPEAAPAGAGTAGERERIQKALQTTAYPGSGRWNLARAARELGINRKSLEYKIRKVYRLE